MESITNFVCMSINTGHILHTLILNIKSSVLTVAVNCLWQLDCSGEINGALMEQQFKYGRYSSLVVTNFSISGSVEAQKPQ